MGGAHPFDPDYDHFRGDAPMPRMREADLLQLRGRAGEVYSAVVRGLVEPNPHRRMHLSEALARLTAASLQFELF